MTKGLSLLFMGALLLALSACAPASGPAVDSAVEESKLRDMEANWVKDWASKDVEKGAAHYTDDATLMSPGMPAMKGKEAIRNGYKMMMADPNIKMDFTAQRVEVSKAGDLAYTQGSYQLTMSDPKTHKPVSDRGSYVTVYKKQADGNWKAVSDIATSEMPPSEVH